MKDEMNIEEVGFAYGMMKSLESQHPKANITFCLKTKRVLITYPLPEDYMKIKDIKFTTTNNEV